MTGEQKRKRVEQLIWIYIFGGLFAVALGIAIGRNDEALGWWIAVPGAIVAGIGVVLIYVRSRMKGDE
jgi:membrane associated rhomboid family serine protease